MNWDRIQGNWKQFKCAAKVKWGSSLTNDWDAAAGRRDQIAGRLQERMDMLSSGASLLLIRA